MSARNASGCLRSGKRCALIALVCEPCKLDSLPRSKRKAYGMVAAHLAVRVRAFPTSDSGGTTTGFIEIVEDITNQKRSEEERSRAKQAAEAANWLMRPAVTLKPFRGFVGRVTQRQCFRNTTLRGLVELKPCRKIHAKGHLLGNGRFRIFDHRFLPYLFFGIIAVKPFDRDIPAELSIARQDIVTVQAASYLRPEITCLTANLASTVG